MIGILEAGAPPAPLIADHGDYSQMISNWLRHSDDRLEFRVFGISDGHFPDNATECDAWIISGSRCSVLDRLPWMDRLMSFLQHAASREIRLLGICFGHQILATAMGGAVQRARSGWIIGSHEYLLVHGPEDRKRLRLNTFHEDQVVEPPSQAQVIGRSNSCPYAILQYGEFALSLQAHPEFSNDYTRALISHRLKDELTRKQYEAAMKGLNQSTDSRMVGDWVARLLI